MYTEFSTSFHSLSFFFHLKTSNIIVPKSPYFLFLADVMKHKNECKMYAISHFVEYYHRIAYFLRILIVVLLWKLLTLSMLWANPANHKKKNKKLMIFFLFFLEIGFSISCKLSTYFQGKKIRKIFQNVNC